MTKLVLLAAALMLLSTLGCSENTPLAPEPAAKLTLSDGIAGGWQAGMLPMRGRLEAVQASEPTALQTTGPCPDSAPAGNGNSVSGTLEPMGEVTGEFKSCGNGTLNYWNGYMVLTDADGDQLELTYWGRFTSFDPTAIPQVIFKGTHRIIGGTGRYAGASGSLGHNGTATFGPDGALSVVNFDGLILLADGGN